MPLDPTLDELASQQPWLPPAVSNFNEQASGVAGGIGKAALGAVKEFNDRLGSVMSTPPGMVGSDLEQQARTAAGLGLDVMGGGMGAGAKLGERGAVGLFGGTLGHWPDGYSDLITAKMMERLGVDRSKIRAATEWFKEQKSGLWNREIYDNPSTLNEFKMPMHANYQNQQSTVGEILNHPELYQVYPHLKDMLVTFKNDPAAFAADNSGSYYWPNANHPNGHIVLNNVHRTGAPETKLTVLHELQHAIDMYEGRNFSKATGLPIEQYFKLIEEARARNVEFRSKFTPEQLQKRDMDPHRTMRQMRKPVDESDVIMPP